MYQQRRELVPDGGGWEKWVLQSCAFNEFLTFSAAMCFYNLLLCVSAIWS